MGGDQQRPVRGIASEAVHMDDPRIAARGTVGRARRSFLLAAPGEQERS
jgi:hypothetical protein